FHDAAHLRVLKKRLEQTRVDGHDQERYRLSTLRRAANRLRGIGGEIHPVIGWAGGTGFTGGIGGRITASRCLRPCLPIPDLPSSPSATRSCVSSAAAGWRRSTWPRTSSTAARSP